jgi:hypothetical protein
MCAPLSKIIAENDRYAVADSARIFSFFAALSETLSDPRDSRGKRHSLAFVIVAAALGIMAGRSKVSGIHRYIENKIGWLREITGMPAAKPVSRAHLPRLLSAADWQEISITAEFFFGVGIQRDINDERVAADGKTLRGTADGDSRQSGRIILGVNP